MWKKIISRLTMKRKQYLFTDKVTAKEVFEWTDKYGQSFMAYDRWSARILKL